MASLAKERKAIAWNGVLARSSICLHSSLDTRTGMKRARQLQFEKEKEEEGKESKTHQFRLGIYRPYLKALALLRRRRMMLAVNDR